MAGATVTSSQGMPSTGSVNGIPGSAIDYGSAYSNLIPPTTSNLNIFNGLGPAQLSTSAIPMQTFTPDQSAISGTSPDWAGWSMSSIPLLQQLENQYRGFSLNPTTGQYNIPLAAFNDPNFQSDLTQLGLGGPEAQNIMSQLSNLQNKNVAGYNATQASNAKGEQFLQQAAIAQNRLLGELNSRGLLNSFENGGYGTADFQQLQNSLDNAVNTNGISLQNELNGLNQQDAAYQLQLANYNNALTQFKQYQQNQQPGLLDIFGTAASALPIIAAI